MKKLQPNITRRGLLTEQAAEYYTQKPGPYSYAPICYLPPLVIDHGEHEMLIRYSKLLGRAMEESELRMLVFPLKGKRVCAHRKRKFQPIGAIFPQNNPRLLSRIRNTTIPEAISELYFSKTGLVVTLPSYPIDGVVEYYMGPMFWCIHGMKWGHPPRTGQNRSELAIARQRSPYQHYCAMRCKASKPQNPIHGFMVKARRAA